MKIIYEEVCNATSETFNTNKTLYFIQCILVENPHEFFSSINYSINNFKHMWETAQRIRHNTSIESGLELVFSCVSRSYRGRKGS